MKNLKIIGASCDLGLHVKGTNYGPLKLKEYIKDIEIIKQKNNSNKNNIIDIYEYNKKLYSKVTDALNDNKIPLTIGGDHSIAVPTALASINKYKNLGIIWFDAHTDFNTLKTTLTNNIHGLPLAIISNYEKMFPTNYFKGSFYNYSNIVVLGARSIDKEEYNNLKDANITIFTVEDIKKYGTEKIYNEAFKIASNGVNALHISYDLDVIDPIYAPGVSIKEEEGINIKQAYDFINKMKENKDIIKSIDIVEYNPLLDKEDKTLKILIDLVNNIKNF